MNRLMMVTCGVCLGISAPSLAQVPTLERDLALTKVPVAVLNPDNLSLGVGSSERFADHATLAMNDDKDILVAFHSVRDHSLTGDSIPAPGAGTYQGEMKQVEVAFYDYDENSSFERWVYVESRVIGAIDHKGIPGLSQTLVSCERPDVVAVGDKFFVIWTRRFSGHEDFGVDQQNEPAILECSWIEKKSGPSPGLNIYGDDGTVPKPGLGFSLDEHLTDGTRDFFVRECAGVPDAVSLETNGSGKLEVAVVYPHFVGRIENPIFPTQPSRLFDIRVVTCTFDPISKEIQKESDYSPLRSNIHFDGDPAPGNQASPGLILPDLAPSIEERAFWMVHEQQRLKSQGPGLNKVPDGRIKLEYYKLEDRLTSPPGNWEQKAAVTFQGSSNKWSWRRRPMISSFTTDAAEHVASIAFSTVSSMDNPSDDSSNVVYEHWQYNQGSLSSPPSYFGITLPPWDTIDFNKQRWMESPLPVHGRTTSGIVRRCYLTGNINGTINPTNLVHWNPFSVPGTETLVDSDANSGFNDIRRPAVSYRYFPGAANPDYFAVTWEKLDNNSLKRIYIMME